MKKLRPQSKIRTGIIIALAVIIFAVYALQLMQIQIVDADMYQEMVQGHTSSTQPIRAVRGEIVDRNGLPLVQNEMRYDVIFDMAFIPKGETNNTILRLIRLFESSREDWIDNLPISKSTPYTLKKDREEDVEALRAHLNTSSYATADDLMYWLKKDYKLEDFDEADARKIAGVRYEMERKDFALNIPYTFASDVDNKMVIQIKERNYELSGVNVEQVAVRTYPDESLAPHILGLVGPLYAEEYEKLKEENLIFDATMEPYDSRGYTLDDTIGKSGIEKAMEKELRGENGLRELQLDANGQVVDARDSIPPVPGNTVFLTIDRRMQQDAQAYLEAQIKHLAETEPPGRGGNANAGAVVVVNVKTGEVLAAATYPSYTVSEYTDDYDSVRDRAGSPLINRATMGQYTPGSIHKPVTALAALDSGTVDASTVFHCAGVYTRFAPYTPKCLSAHGNISIHNALGWSCNIFFYEAGYYTGIDKMDAVAQGLGLGEYTGVEIEEARGHRSNPEVKTQRGAGEWYGADTIQTAIGQFDNLYSPLQMANYAATIANRGQRMKLSFIKEIRDYGAQDILQPFEKEVAHQMELSDYAWDVTTEGMILATTGSSGGTFAGYPMTVAAKTGTPQVTKDIVNSTYITFAPVEDPELAIAVIIEEGWQGYTGAPIAKAIYDDYFGITHRGAVASGPQRLKDSGWIPAMAGGTQEYNPEDYQPETPTDTPSSQPDMPPPADVLPDSGDIPEEETAQQVQPEPPPATETPQEEIRGPTGEVLDQGPNALPRTSPSESGSDSPRREENTADQSSPIPSG